MQNHILGEGMVDYQCMDAFKNDLCETVFEEHE